MSLRNAFAHLTALRIPPRARIPLSRSLHYFPWIGAAIGSLNILFFLAVSRVLPAPAACLLAVIFPQALAGFSPWRGVIEAARGIRTLPGHGFPPGFRPGLRGCGIVAAIVLAKWGALALLPHDWQVRAVFVFPILGLCARTGAFLLEARETRAAHAHRASRPDARIARLRVRAGFLSGVLLFLAFLFPARAAVVLLAAGAMAAWWALRARRLERTHRDAGLTLQRAAVVSEAVEFAVLAGLAFAGLMAFRF